MGSELRQCPAAYEMGLTLNEQPGSSASHVWITRVTPCCCPPNTPDLVVVAGGQTITSHLLASALGTYPSSYAFDQLRSATGSVSLL